MIDSLSGDIFRPKNTNVFGAVIPTESILRTVEFTGGGNTTSFNYNRFNCITR